MELKQYLLPLRKWWWLLIASTFVSTLSAYISTRFQVPVYQTRASLMIGQSIEDPNPDSVSFYLSQQLAQSYVEIARRQQVRQATMEVLGLTWLPEYSVGLVPNTQLLDIAVIDTVPERAQAVANTLAQQLVLQSPTATQDQDQERQAFIQQQLDSLQQKITQTDQEIEDIQSQIGDMVSARQIADAQNQIAALQSKLTTLQSNYAILLANTDKGAVNSLQIVEFAQLPTAPIGPQNTMTILLGVAIGFTLAAGVAYLMEYLDDTLKSPEEITRSLELPIIGFIAESNNGDKEEETVIVAKEPRSPVAEAFRTLRTNLEFAGVGRPLCTILVTSPGPSDGKSTVAANLAAIIAQGGKRVVLVDADLRRPRVHRFMKVSNRVGLSDIFRDQQDIAGASQTWTESTNSLQVIASGSLPPNPAELLGSEKMDQILAQLKETADVIIIDSPPFMVSDASVLAAKVDGVLLVLQPGRTNANTAKALSEQFKRAGARMVGVVLNRIPRKRGLYGYGDGYYYYYNSYAYSDHYETDGLSTNGHHKPAKPHKTRSLWRRTRPAATEAEPNK